MDLTSLVCPERVATEAKPVASHNLSVPSAPAPASIFPSGRNATAWTGLPVAARRPRSSRCVCGPRGTLWAFLEGARPTWREWRASCLIGLLILACGAGAGTYGQLTVASGVAGVLSALLPLFAAVMGYCV